MTGEPIGIKKGAPSWKDNEKVNPFLISSSKILEGTGRMVVLAVGEHSQYGILKKTLVQEEDETPLQTKLSVLADQIGKVGMFSAAITFIAMLGHILHGAWASGDFTGSLFSLDTVLHLVDAFIISVSIIVVAVPEGLPLSVTIALAYSVGKMKDENNLVRFLQACETMGGADNICSDKTGTLTLNKMTVTKFFVCENTIDNPGKENIKEKVAEKFSIGVAINSSANPKFEGDTIDQIGNKTDCALLHLGHKCGYNYRQLRKDFSDSIVKVVPFSSDTKSMSTVVKEKGKAIAYCKGAPDFVMKNCTSYLDASGNPARSMTPSRTLFKASLKNLLTKLSELSSSPTKKMTV